MHIPDGFVSTPINAVTGVIAFATLAYSLKQARKEMAGKPHMVPLLAMSAAFVFAAQMLNFPIGGGTSGHFLGAATVAALLGPWSACIVMAVVLAIQCLLFSDGGLLALGSNILNMGIIGGIAIYPLMRGVRTFMPESRFSYVVAGAIASWASVFLASLACSLELAASGTSPLEVVLMAMLGTHAIIGIGEALICAAVLTAVTASRPDILPEWANVYEQPKRRAKASWKFMAAGLLLAALLALFVSPYASSSPDGLDKTAEEKGFVDTEQKVWTGSLFPDYKIESVKQEEVSTSLAGLIGTMLTFMAGFGVIKLATRSKA